MVTLYCDVAVTLQYICLAEQLVILITHTPEIYAAPPCRFTSPLYVEPLSYSWLIFVMGWRQSCVLGCKQSEKCFARVRLCSAEQRSWLLPINFTAHVTFLKVSCGNDALMWTGQQQNSRAFTFGLPYLIRLVCELMGERGRWFVILTPDGKLLVVSRREVRCSVVTAAAVISYYSTRAIIRNG